MNNPQIESLEKQIADLLEKREQMKKEFAALKNEHKLQIAQFKREYDAVVLERHELLAELAALKAEGVSC